MIAMVAHSVNYPDQKDQAIGDARLIAVAPRLLGTLEMLLECLRYGDIPQDAAAWDEVRESVSMAKDAE